MKVPENFEKGNFGQPQSDPSLTQTRLSCDPPDPTKMPHDLSMTVNFSQDPLIDPSQREGGRDRATIYPR